MVTLPDPAAVARPWCDSYPPGVPPHVDVPDAAVTTLLDRAARDHPVGDALVHGRRRWSWREVVDLVGRAAAELDVRGVGRGDRVAIVSPTTPASVVALFACWRVGAVAVPIEPAPGELLVSRLVDARPAAVVVDVRWLDVVDEVRSRLVGCRAVWVTDPAHWALVGRRLAARLATVLGRRRGVGADDDVVAFDSVLTAAPDDGSGRAVPAVAVGGDDPAVLLWSAGETVSPRPVTLDHRALLANATQIREWVVDLRDGREVVLVAGALGTGVGLVGGLLTGMGVGATVILLESPAPGAVAAAIEREGVTLLPGPVALFEQVVAARSIHRRDLSSLRVALAVGAPLDPAAARRFERIATGARLRQCYGVVEAGAVVIACPVYGEVGDHRVGLPLSSTVAAVVGLDDPTRRVASGDVGELLIAGPQVVGGRGRWLATGDLASTTDGGSFTLHGRVEDVIDRAGHVLVPARVERALRLHPRVADAAVVGVVAGDAIEVVGVVETVGRLRVSSRRLQHHLAGIVDEEDRPDRVVVERTLPRSSSGGIDRRCLQQSLTDGSAPDDGVATTARVGDGVST